MGQKVHPYGFRLGYIFDWQSKWYAEKAYVGLLHEDLAIRKTIGEMLPDAGISRTEIERNANQVTVTIHTARPGIVIGRGGQRVDELRARLESISGRRVRVNINEIRVPELDAALVSKAIASQLERRVSHRRAIKQAISRTMQRGALGIKVRVAGRLGGSEMTRKEKAMEGRVPLHTLKADIDYGIAEAHTTLGRIGVKTWIYKGDRIQEKQQPPKPGTVSVEAQEEAPPESVEVAPENVGAPAESIEAAPENVEAPAESVEAAPAIEKEPPPAGGEV